MENNNFNNWYNKIVESISIPKKAAEANEDNATQTADVTAATTSTEASKANIISDVDSIMNTLSQLSVQIKEAINSLDLFENEEVEILEEEIINEVDASDVADSIGKAGSKIADWIFYAPKYRNMQKKINKMKLNALDIQIAIDALGNSQENKPKAEALKAKKTTLSQQISDLQSSVNDKAKERGEYIQKVLSSEKIKGQMELVKRSSGQEDDPSKKKSLADSMKELQARFKEEEAAIAKLKDKAKQDNTDKSVKDKTEPNKEKIETDKKEEPKKDSNAELEAEIKAYNDNISVERSSIEKAKAELKTEKDPEKIAKLKDSIQKSNEDIKDMKDSIKNLKAKFSAKESLIFAANELGLNEMAAEIASKQDWQFENNSALYVKYNTEITKQGSINKLNESRYQNLSTADKFRMLLG